MGNKIMIIKILQFYFKFLVQVNFGRVVTIYYNIINNRNTAIMVVIKRGFFLLECF